MEARREETKSSYLAVSTMGITEFEEMYIELAGDNIYDWTTPDQARAELDRIGYDEADWQTILDNSKASHHVRSLMIIAQGEIPRMHGVLQLNFRALDYMDDPFARLVFDDPSRQTEALRAKINTE